MKRKYRISRREKKKAKMKIVTETNKDLMRYGRKDFINMKDLICQKWIMAGVVYSHFKLKK